MTTIAVLGLIIGLSITLLFIVYKINRSPNENNNKAIIKKLLIIIVILIILAMFSAFFSLVSTFLNAKLLD